MNELSTITKTTMSSLEIAELTNKPHNDVLKDIRRILAEVEIDQGLFSQVYKAGNGQMQPCFNLPRRECDLIIAGYSSKYRLAIIDRWQEMEYSQPKVPTNFIEAMQLATATLIENQALKEEKEKNSPKVEFAEKVRALDGSISVGDFAKLIGTGQNRLFKRLRDDGFLMINNHPMQSAVERGLLVQIEQTPFTDSNNKSHPAFQTRITGKGQVYFEKKYRVNIPVMVTGNE